MQEVLALALQSMQQDMQRVDRIGSNLANALTPGYQRDVMARQAVSTSTTTFQAFVDAQRVGGPGTGLHVEQPGTLAPALLVHTDTRPGSLKSTGQSLDVALAGPGYFEVATPSGPAYTRQGNFHLDARGRLVNASGLPVMGKGGEIYLKAGNPFIDASGNIFEAQETGRVPGDSAPVAQLKVLVPQEQAAMRRIGEGLLSAGGPLDDVKEADIQLKQGFTENSNVNSMQEMVQLVETMRHFESMQKVVLGYDDMTGQAIRKLGDLS